MEENIKFKVIIDTNILISFLIGKSINNLPFLLYSKKILLITTDEQINELVEVLFRKKFQKYFSKEQVYEFLSLLENYSQNFPLKTTTDICRDPKDNYLLSLCVDSEADFLISGDADLLEIKQISKTIIISYSEFEETIKGK